MKPITGDALIALGLRPGKQFKEHLAYVNAYALEGEALMEYVAANLPPPEIPLHETPIFFHENIVADTELEQGNIDSVRKTMTAVMRTPTVVSGAVMPDACPSGPLGHIPVGGVVVTRNAIHPGMHSADICCSLMLTNFGKIDPKTVLDRAHSITHFGPGGRDAEKQFELPKEFPKAMKANPFLKNDRLIRNATAHLGTQGDGNHFLYVGISQNTGDTVMVTHHGSRGVGAMLYNEGMKIAERFRKQLSPTTLPANAWIPFDTEEGALYWEALQLVRDWTKLNHTVLHDEIVRKLKVAVQDRFWNEHNFVFKDGDLFYHAKGATPVDTKFMPDITGPQIIPLNMGQPILLVEGATTQNNLGFAPHGAGRNMSRSKHKQSFGDKSHAEIFVEETKGIDARFFFEGIDISELPSAYKNADEVKRQIQHFDLANIVDEIMPYGSIMAGDWQKDAPWRKKKKR